MVFLYFTFSELFSFTGHLSRSFFVVKFARVTSHLVQQRPAVFFFFCFENRKNRKNNDVQSILFWISMVVCILSIVVRNRSKYRVERKVRIGYGRPEFDLRWRWKKFWRDPFVFNYLSLHFEQERTADFLYKREGPADDTLTFRLVKISLAVMQSDVGLRHWKTLVPHEFIGRSEDAERSEHLKMSTY